MWKNGDEIQKNKETPKNNSCQQWFNHPWIVVRSFFKFPEIISCFSTFSTKRLLNILTRLETLFETGTWTGLTCSFRNLRTSWFQSCPWLLHFFYFKIVAVLFECWCKSYLQRPCNWRISRNIRTINTWCLTTREQKYGC